MNTLLQEIRFGIRVLRKNPGFAVVVILTLALGIGANTAMFAVVDTVLLRPLPYKDSDRLVTIWGYNRTRGFTTDQVSPQDFTDWRSENHSFESMAASTDATYTLTGVGEPSLVIAYQFSTDFFRVLGASPLMGRTFLPEEEQAGKDHVTVLSYSFWQSHFGADPSLLGKTIHLDSAAYTVVGIMPPGFQYPSFTQLWTPLTVTGQAAIDRDFRYLRIMGRLKPGVTLAQAQVEMNGIASRLALAYPATNKDEDSTNLISLRQMISGDIRPALLVLLCAVGFVLLIACANVANLLLARAVSREKEVVVRAALGASRSRLVRQFLTESALLGLAGGTLGLLFAWLGTGPVMAMFPATIFNLRIPRVDKIQVDAWVVAFAAAASLLTAAISGLAAALLAGRPNMNESLNASARTSTGSARGRRLRSSLVVSELALSLTLLTAAGLALKSFAHLLQADPGFHSDHLLTLRVLLPHYKYQTESEQVAFSDQVLDRIKSLPGVNAAGTVTFLPLSGWLGSRAVSRGGLSTPQGERPMSLWSSITPDYFRALGIPLKGRTFSDADNLHAPQVAIISESLARQLLPNVDPIGQHINADGLKAPVEVVGVAGDVHQLGVTSEYTAEIYFPFSQVPAPILCFAIRTASDPANLSKAAQQAIWAVDKDQSIGYIMPMQQLESESLAPQRVITILLGIFAAMALLMAAIGTYGVISYFASLRTREIGIRMALGAQRFEVLSIVLLEALRLIAVSLAGGLAIALALTRFLSSVLYGISATDPLVFVLVPVLLAMVALIACYIPARRVSLTDPMVALRYE